MQSVSLTHPLLGALPNAPLLRKVTAADFTRFRSIAPVMGALVVVLGFFAFLYLREWYINRYCERIRQDARKKGLFAVVRPDPDRRPLLATPRRSPAAQKPPHHQTTEITTSQTCTPLWIAPSTPQPQAPVPACQPETGTLNVEANDIYSEIFVDGSFAGNPPARLTLAEGPHTIEIKRKGCNDHLRHIHVIAGAELNLRAVLVKNPNQPA